MDMGAALFLAIWVVMMIAMMFPAAAPMILVFAQVQRDRRRGGWAFLPTWIFAGAYLLIWTLFGELIYLGANVSGVLAQQVPWLMMNASRIVGGIVVLAGLYQLTPLKRVCLAKCCTPLGMMNIAAMALLTALIFAEKVVPRGARIAQFAALALILYGALVIVVPAALPLSGAGM